MLDLCSIQSAIPQFTKWELFRNRSIVEQKLFNAVRQRLGGICCSTGCEKEPHGMYLYLKGSLRLNMFSG